jgi:hypothetical protein
MQAVGLEEDAFEGLEVGRLTKSRIRPADRFGT